MNSTQPINELLNKWQDYIGKTLLHQESSHITDELYVRQAMHLRSNIYAGGEYPKYIDISRPRE